jgi:acetyl esterase
MNAVVESQYEIEIKDVEYLKHGNKPFLARLYIPKGKGPFPMMVEAHGGAWVKQDRFRNARMDEMIARSGVVVMGLEFRMPPADEAYPASVADIHYAVRWIKSRAAEFGGDANKVVVIGTSSGGHQAALVAMRPKDSRYAAVPLAGGFDATVRAAVLCWPVIDPLGRYQKVKQEAAEGKTEALDTIASHDLYWKTEAAMDEGSPTRALERGEKAVMPPVLYLQGTADKAHPRPHLDRFVAEYRKAGGRLDLHWVEGVGQNFVNDHPDNPGVAVAVAKIIEFVKQETR